MIRVCAGVRSGSTPLLALSPDGLAEGTRVSSQLRQGGGGEHQVQHEVVATGCQASAHR